MKAPRIKFVYDRQHKVTKTHDYWKALITDMEIIDATKNAEWAKSSDIRQLRDMVKRNGTHYNKHGERID
jgi:hypothetical protein